MDGTVVTVLGRSALVALEGAASGGDFSFAAALLRRVIGAVLCGGTGVTGLVSVRRQRGSCGFARQGVVPAQQWGSSGVFPHEYPLVFQMVVTVSSPREDNVACSRFGVCALCLLRDGGAATQLDVR